ncbi:hypothetical protein BH11VER1_BH11VER1_26470 [soil metagenome]
MHLPSYRYTPRYLSGQSAWVQHLPFAYDLVSLVKPETVVELGTWLGDSFFTFCQAVRDAQISTTCYAVDHWKGDEQAGAASFSLFEVVQQHCVQHYQSFAYLMKSDFNDAAHEFTPNTIDLLHIDGFHSYESVRNDFETWFPLVRDGGIVLFHDIKVRSNVIHQNFGVWKLWEELKTQHETREFRQGFGLGILFKGTPPANVEEWLEPENFKILSDYYETRGSEIEKIALTKSREIELNTMRRQHHALNDRFEAQNANIALLTAQIHRLEDACREKHAENKILDQRMQALNRKALQEKEKRVAKEKALKRVVKSAENWQRRSWFTRAFHKWRA